jgi:protoporphyrinogen IX oxidase
MILTVFPGRLILGSPPVGQILVILGNQQVHRAYINIYSLRFFLSLRMSVASAGDMMITDLLSSGYLVVKVLHILSVTAWMAGLFYLPRLFVYHAEVVQNGSPTDSLFQTMERRLLRQIMNPAMVATWVFGLCLVFTPGVVSWDQAWPWVKGISVIAMTGFHMWLGGRRKDFLSGNNTRSGRTYRIMNEVPTVLLVFIVASVVVKF